jgi:hypothetical protein
VRNVPKFGVRTQHIIMERQIGIWLDRTKALVVTLHGDEEHFNKIPSGVETRERIPGESNQGGRFGEQFIDTEHKKEARIQRQLDAFYKSIHEAVRNAEAIYVFGPADTKIGLAKALKADKQLADRIRAVEQADSMTDNQVRARVREFFGE